MKKLFGLLAPALTGVFCRSRRTPGVGIVMDRHGNVFYTDLVQVWMISPDGRRSIAVPKVHTHELAIDSDDKSDRRGGPKCRRRLAAPGVAAEARWRITDLIHWQDGFWQDYGFNRDRAGAYYNLACAHAEMNDLDSAIKNLRLAFSYKANMIPGEQLPDPAGDDSFARFLSNPRFRKLLEERGSK